MAWSALPDAVRAHVENRLGFTVSHAHNVSGGFTPGVAAAVSSEGGDRAFIKAINAALTPQGPDIYRREARVAAALPVTAPVSRLLWADTNVGEGWVVLAFEHIQGRIPDLGDADDLVLVLDALTNLASVLDPTPVADLPTFTEMWGDKLDAWSQVTPASSDRFPGYPDWLPHARAALADLALGWRKATSGDALLHGDMRADNLLVVGPAYGANRSVVAVDWPEACVGAGWTDLVTALPSFAMQGVDPEAVVAEHPLTRDVPADSIDALLAGLAGFFTSRSLLPAPKGLPTVRAFQRAQANAALAWIARRRPGLAMV